MLITTMRSKELRLLALEMMLTFIQYNLSFSVISASSVLSAVNCYQSVKPLKNMKAHIGFYDATNFTYL